MKGGHIKKFQNNFLAKNILNLQIKNTKKTPESMGSTIGEQIYLLYNW